MKGVDKGNQISAIMNYQGVPINGGKESFYIL